MPGKLNPVQMQAALQQLTSQQVYRLRCSESVLLTSRSSAARISASEPSKPDATRSTKTVGRKWHDSTLLTSR